MIPRRAEPRTATQTAWLFMKDGLRLQVATTGPRTIRITRPDVGEYRYTFRSATGLERFQIVVADQLTKAGWLLVPPGDDPSAT